MISTDTIRFAEKADFLRKLHNSDTMLALPNVWDPLGAILMEELRYKAIATASAAVAYANGYDDGENIPFEDFLRLHRRICECVNIPVTADIESGFAADNEELSENIRKLISVGIVGINIEDTDKSTGKMRSADAQRKRIEIVRETARDAGVPIVINARTDVLLHSDDFDQNVRLTEIISRGRAYKDAGADCFFPILLSDSDEIAEVTAEVSIPVNIIQLPGAPDLQALESIGVKRVSLGPSVLKAAFRAVRDLASEIKSNPHFAGVNEDIITSPFLKQLVTKRA